MDISELTSLKVVGFDDFRGRVKILTSKSG